MTRSARRSLAASLAVVAALGAAGAVRGDAVACGDASIEFAQPKRLGTGRGYEPGIEVDSNGTIYVTAHKLSLAREESTRLSSFLWRSTDGGASFGNLWGPAGIGQAFWAFEGDLAVDANDRLYFVDTWAGDNHFFRYAPDGALELARPAVATYEVDDRPWLAAHGDGFVYYLSNTGYKHDGRLTIHRSTDGGLTFDPVGFTMPRSGWGFIDADPNGPYVYSVVNDVFYGTGPLGQATGIYAFVSPDRGRNWTQVKIADYEYGYDRTSGHDDAYPVVAVSPVDGSVWALWTDDGKAIKLARSTDHGTTWRVEDVTPFEGVYSFSWMAVGPNGEIGITFAADPLDLDGAQHWVYGMVLDPDPDCVTGDAQAPCGQTSGAFGRLQDRTVGGYASQADFFQVDFTPDGSLVSSWTGIANAIMFTRQIGGPNLGGVQPCGIAGQL